jgi:hypothetical protein
MFGGFAEGSAGGVGWFWTHCRGCRSACALLRGPDTFSPRAPRRLLLHSFCYDRVLTPVQLARAAVASRPFFPDLYALVKLQANAAC